MKPHLTESKTPSPLGPYASSLINKNIATPIYLKHSPNLNPLKCLNPPSNNPFWPKYKLKPKSKAEPLTFQNYKMIPTSLIYYKNTPS